MLVGTVSATSLFDIQPRPPARRETNQERP